MVKLYVIVVYDVNVSRVTKVCQFLRQYLNWVQNSVFEGELSESQLEEVKVGLKEILDLEQDSITIYILPAEKFLKREYMGKRKAELSSVI
ncbi:MAG: CRISPR-associated endonuclease Cas2 [Thermoproteota archaeon]